jgi:hypothetical protein
LPTHEIFCADAIQWLSATTARGAVVTSLPDADEVGLDITDWGIWFAAAATACFRVLAPGAPVVFFQTDRKAGGGVYSKASSLVAAASQAGARLLWHKIVLRRPVGAIDLHRPGYSHLMAFGMPGARPGPATPDVIENGRALYRNGIGAAAAAVAVRFAGRNSAMIIDPSCGRGAIGAAALDAGLNTIGVDIDPAQCDRARANLASAAASLWLAGFDKETPVSLGPRRPP